jgi:hypothetical protein
MRALLHDRAVVHHQDQFRVTDGREAVRDDEAGATLHESRHGALDQEDNRISTLDLFGTSFVLLTSPAGTPWHPGAEQASASLGIPLRCFTIGLDGPLADSAGVWIDQYEVGPEGAVLVRPDGHVTWRASSAGADPATQVRIVLRRVLSLD